MLPKGATGVGEVKKVVQPGIFGKDGRIDINFTYIYGIGRTKSNEILKEAGINPDTRVKDLTEDEVIKIREIIDKGYKVEGDLRRDTALNIKKWMEREEDQKGRRNFEAYIVKQMLKIFVRHLLLVCVEITAIIFYMYELIVI